MSQLNSDSLKTATSESEKNGRWYWLDWLRVLAMATIFLYHSGRPFVPFEWHVMNPEPDLIFTLVNVFVTGWIMPLFFVISGMATYFSLAKRGRGEYAWSRFKRLMIPFIFALFIVLPTHTYYRALFHGYFSGTFTEYYFWNYFTRAFPFDSDVSPTYFAGSNQGIYLWYIFWLFVFSLITIHFFKWLKKNENCTRISELATFCNRRWGIFLLAIPLIAVDIVAVKPFFVFPSDYGGWKLPTYLVFFVLAYVMASDVQFEQSIDKNRITALLMGVSASVFIIVLFVTFGVELLGSSLFYVPFTILWAFNGWCWVIAILGYGRKCLGFNHRCLGISNELILPFYILHETVIVAIAFYVVGLDLAVIVKYLIIVFASFTVISLLLLPIRKINLMRFLFGMRVRKRDN